MSSMRQEPGAGIGRWSLAGLTAGLIAGVVFIVFELIQAAVLGPGPFGPLRLISALILGFGALPPPPVASLSTVIPVGLIVHFILSALYGVVFGGAVSLVGFLRSSRGALIATASIYGLLLWIFNFYIVAPVLFPWFTEANPWCSL